MTLVEMQTMVGEGMESQGFHDDFRSGNFVTETVFRIGLTHTEVSEALQLIKRGMKDTDDHLEAPLAEEFGLEMADVLIRIFDLAWLLRLELVDGTDVASSLADLQARNDRSRAMAEVVELLKTARLRKEIGATLTRIHSYLSIAASVADNSSPGATGLAVWQADQIAVSFVTAASGLISIANLLHLDMQEAVITKMNQNMKRPYRYGTADAGQKVG